MKDKLKILMREVKLNQRRLDKCDGHSFELITQDHIRFICIKCKGEISKINKYWYEQGVKHGKV